MRVNGKHFAGAVKATLLFVSTDETRPHLNAIRFEIQTPEKGEASLRLIATDGHRMFACEIAIHDVDPKKFAAVDPRGFLLARKDAALVVRAAAANGKLYPDNMPLAFGLKDGTFAGVTVPRVEAQFPPYAQVLPDLATMIANPGKVPPAASATYFAETCEAFNIYGAAIAVTEPKKKGKPATSPDQANPSIVTLTSGEMDPIVFVSEALPRALAIVMPMRQDKNTISRFAGAAHFARTLRTITPATKSDRNVAAAE